MDIGSRNISQLPSLNLHFGSLLSFEQWFRLHVNSIGKWLLPYKSFIVHHEVFCAINGLHNVKSIALKLPETVQKSVGSLVCLVFIQFIFSKLLFSKFVSCKQIICVWNLLVSR